MEKERINLFDGDQKLLPGRSQRIEKIKRRGSAMFSTLALGVALFAIVFIICCFAGEFGMPIGAWRDNPTPTAPSDFTGTLPFSDNAISTTIAEPSVTCAPAPATSNDGGLLEFLKGILGALTGGGKTPATTIPETPAATEPALPVYVDENELYYFDYSRVPSGHTPIVPMDMSLINYGETYIYNDTKYAPKIAALADSKDAIPAFNYLNAAIYPAGDPVVLIIHTHGTEAYSEEGAVSYDGVGELARSTDITKNVVAVGAVIAEILNDRGVKTLHCTIMHDQESYKDSYMRSAATIAEYLSRYPSIQYVIDVHRDSLTTSSGSIVRPVTLVDGHAVAQVMCVVGSDYNGADYPDWQKNLSFALKLRQALNAKYKNLARPVYLRGSAYNQQYSPMAMLLEVGTSGNTLSEAKEAAHLCANALVDIIKGKESQ